MKVRQAIFLNRFRKENPQPTIDRAFINEQSELGVVFNPAVEMDKLPDLMKTILEKMGQDFPDQDLTIVAYTPSDPPRKVGTGQRNAKTGENSYTPTTN